MAANTYEIFERRFSIKQKHITERPDGECLITAGATSHEDEYGVLCYRGMVLMSGLNKHASHATIIRHFGPSIARSLRCRLDTLSWLEWQSDGFVMPIRVDWGAILSNLDSLARKARAHPMPIDWFITPEQTVQRFLVSGGKLAAEMIKRHSTIRNQTQTYGYACLAAS